MMQRRVQVHVLVSGEVQGVGYRFSTQRQATAWGLRGWVRNLPDGNVEAVFQGPEASVDAMVAWCKQGPLRASVVEVVAARQPVEAFEGFDVRN